jgi:hypothetical protein
MPKHTHKREYYIRPNAVKVADKHSTAVVYVYTDTHGFTDKNGNQTTYVVAFQAKRQKPDHNYRFPKGPKAAERWIKEYFAGVQANEQAKADYKARQEAEADQVEVGGIYYTSWGYDQTNVDFYQVVGRTAKTVQYIGLGKTVHGTDCPAADKVVADTTIKGKEVHTAKINGNGWRIGTFRFARPWNGQPQHQTATGWGH